MAEDENGQVSSGQNDPDAESDPASGSGDSSSRPTGTTLSPESFKGLQRRLTAEQNERKKLEQQIAQLQSGSGNNAMIQSLLQELANINPQRAQEVAQAVSVEQLRQENIALKTKSAQDEWNRLVTDQELENMQTLREIVEALGVDPDSKLIDYGSPENASMAQRMKQVKNDALAAKSKANVTPPEKRTVGSGTAHNTQVGTPVAPVEKKTSITDDELAQAQAEFNKNPHSKAAQQKLREAFELAQI